MKAIEQIKSSMKGGRLKSGLAGMSPAAQRLASSKLGIRLGTDDMLRASYTPTPHRGTGTPTPRATPTRATPSPMTKNVGKQSATPGGKPQDKVVVDESLTDNLLNISGAGRGEKGVAGKAGQISTDNLLNLGKVAAKRTRAQDFFMKPSSE